MKIIFRLLCCALCVLLLLPLCACNVKIDDEAAFLAEVAELIERSYEVNELFFGEGLPFVDPEGKSAAELVSEASGELNARTIYRPVAEDALYQTESEIMDLARSVYSEDYANHLQTVGFTGVSDENETVATYARYITTVEGGLTINMESVTKAIPLTRRFDTATLAVVRLGRDYAVVSADAYDGDTKTGSVQLRVNKEPSGWRLDWPTY